MRKVLLGLFLFFNTLYLNAQGPIFQWGKTAYGSWAPVSDIKIDAAGNVYLAGYFNTIFDFDLSPGVAYMTPINGFDCYVVKFDAAGNFVWAQQIDNGAVEEPLDIAVDVSGKIYVGGFYRITPAKNYIGFVTEILPTSVVLGTWTLRDTISSSLNSNNVVTSVDIGPSGDIYAAGTFRDTIDLNQGAGTYMLYNKNPFWLNAFVCRLGSTFWGKSFETTKYSKYNEVKTILVDNIGNVYCGGTYLDSTDFDPGAGSYYVPIGNSSINNSFLTKLDATGNFSWAKTHVGGAAVTYSVRSDNSSNIYLYGGFGGTVDFDMGVGTYTLNTPSSTFFASKLDPLANFQWVVPVSGMTVTSADVDGFGNTYLSGLFTVTTDFDPGPSSYTLSSLGGDDEFITMLDANGNFVWAGQIGSPAQEQGIYTSANTVGELANYGWAGYGVDLDPGPLTYTLVGNDFVSKFFPGTSSGITQLKDNEVSVFPNPTTGQFNMMFEKPIENANVKIINSLGEIVLQKKIIHSNRLSLSIVDQPAGIYFVEINYNFNTQRIKLIHQ